MEPVLSPPTTFAFLRTARLMLSGTLVAAALGGCSSESPPPATEVADTDAVEEETDTEAELDPSIFSDKEIEIILAWLGPLPDAPPPDLSNAYADDPAAAALGLKLFFDSRYSGNGEVSCATCHEPADAFGDSRSNTSLGISVTGRASIALFNGAYGAAAENETNWQLWDGRADSQWGQALGPPESGVVMGGTRSGIALLIFDEYAEEYEAIFGPLPELRDEAGDPVVDPTLKPGEEGWDALPQDMRDSITEVYVNFGKSLAAYERLLVSRDSRFDEFWTALSQGDTESDALTEQERHGLRVFIGKGRCLGCHSGPNFTDNQFHNIGIAQSGENIPENDEGRIAGVGKLLGNSFNCASEWSDHPDPTQCAVETLQGGELGAFRTPTLRSVSLSPPYMHTGNFASLEAVIQHYDLGGAANGSFDGVRDELMRPLSLDAHERQALVAFLRALEGAPLDEALMGPQ
ncbi:MAG: cytochrome-c peroxidase [Nannocystales bacterium]